MKKNLVDNGYPYVPVCVASRIAGALAELKAGLGGASVNFIPVPVLFDNYAGAAGFRAYTANLANCLVGQGGKVYYPEPGIEKFREYFEGDEDKDVKGIVPSAKGGARNVWLNYHCRHGEVHCGTAAVREMSSAPSPWWDENDLKGWE